MGRREYETKYGTTRHCGRDETDTMRSTITRPLTRIDTETRIQYGLMLLFGTLCLLAAVAPLELMTKVVVVSVLFGFTGGLWVSHLVQIVQRAAPEAET
ncbi:putative membrane protein [Halomicrobium sp. LC1Hm]|nr:putative membrane protein [Halomicrobium sp. LC1Hm]